MEERQLDMKQWQDINYINNSFTQSVDMIINQCNISIDRYDTQI